MVRHLAVSIRALACEEEYKDQGFDQLPSKQYAIRVRMIQAAGDVGGTENDSSLMEELQFKNLSLTLV